MSKAEFKQWIKKMRNDIDTDYTSLVNDCFKHKFDFEISCNAIEHKKYILKLMGDVKKLVDEGVEYYIGRKYEVLYYNTKHKVGEANFNNKPIWLRIKKGIEIKAHKREKNGT